MYCRPLKYFIIWLHDWLLVLYHLTTWLAPRTAKNNRPQPVYLSQTLLVLVCCSYPKWVWLLYEVLYIQLFSSHFFNMVVNWQVSGCFVTYIYHGSLIHMTVSEWHIVPHVIRFTSWCTEQFCAVVLLPQLQQHSPSHQLILACSSQPLHHSSLT